MRYISIEECLSQIDEKKIDRENHANVYLCRTSSEVVLQLAYSQDKQDHIVLKQTSLPSDGNAYEEIWTEYLAVSMIIEHSYRVKRFVDDVREKRWNEMQAVAEGLNLFKDEKKQTYYDEAEKYLADNDLECLKIDRDRFAYSGKEHIVKIYLLPFNKKTVSREQLAKAKTLEKIVITNDRYSRQKQGTVIPTRENGYIKFNV